ncbi:hypothetical protein CEXT_584381 [Caerostris extrusa]|uniref:Uncharacterized protein n=1 Tax=Caerostris extrusa TaxID=172846 RepID=A0AAV4XB70_CAEEX|nr:hypothetical protein CEXT_584381 [Caerostris extrusa]
MTKRFQTETLGSDFFLRRANIYGIVCKSLRCKITRSNSPPGDTIVHPFAHALPHPTQNEFFTFTVFLSAPQQFIRLRSEKCFLTGMEVLKAIFSDSSLSILCNSWEMTSINRIPDLHKTSKLALSRRV